MRREIFELGTHRPHVPYRWGSRDDGFSGFAAIASLMESPAAPGSFDLYAGYQGMASGRTVTGIPINGSPIYVRLVSWVTSLGGWRSDYVYPTGAP